MIAPTIVNGAGDYPIRVMNMSEQPRVLEQGNLIAGVEEVDELKGKPVEHSHNTDDLPAHLRELYAEIEKSAGLKGEIAEQFREFLKKYSNVFATSDKDLGQTDLVQHNIETGDNSIYSAKQVMLGGVKRIGRIDVKIVETSEVSNVSE